ncbi:Do family serine endopeptidase [bacterium]|nr:Do family serine endopeptidase [bacterium]
MINKVTMKKGITVLAIAIIGGLVALGINKLVNPGNQNQSFQEYHNAQFTNADKLADVPATDFVSVANVSKPAVVHIKTTIAAQAGSQNPQMFDPFHFFDGPMGPQGPQEATGSGVIIRDNGYIATNNHVVDNAQKVEVVLEDKRTYIAEVIGTDPETDLALLKIEEENLPFLKFGNSDNLNVGEWVVAVGNPFNLTSTVTAGIVSAKGRNINLLRQRGGEYAIENFIQTDAAVNPGNSGGALVNTQGQLVGINTAIASRTGSYSGYSFAIPINLASKILDDLLKYGEVKRAILGVRIQDISQELADDKGLKDLQGVYIPEVIEGGAADKAGLKSGDVITHINEIEVNKSSSLQEQISKYYPGDKVDIDIIRDGKKKELTVTLLSKEGMDEITTTTAREEKTVLGAEIQNLSRDEKLEKGIRYGVKISKLSKGVIKDKGISEGFIITSIDKAPMYTTSDVEKALSNKSGAVLLEGVNPDGSKEAYALRLD